MIKIKKKFLLLFIVMGLYGCACENNRIIVNRDTEYLRARSICPLAIPPGYSSSTIHAHYPISEGYYSNRLCKLDLTPPELQRNVIHPSAFPTANTGRPMTRPCYIVPRMTCPAPSRAIATNYYYDSYTRGPNQFRPLGTWFNWFRSWNANAQPMQNNGNSALTYAQKPSKINGTPATMQKNATQPQVATNTPAPRMPNMYFDRYSSR